MKYIILVCCALWLPYDAYSQSLSPTDAEVLRCSGDAILRVPPDQIVLNIGLKLRGEDLARTKEKHKSIMDRVIAHCIKSGVPSKYIQTDYIQIKPVFPHNYQVQETVDHYDITQLLTIVIDDLDKYETLLTELIDLGINRVDQISYRTTKLKEHRYAVRKMAIEAAKEKAAFLADEVGITLGDIVNISEYAREPTTSFGLGNYANISQNAVQLAGENPDDSGPSAGLISLHATINLTYRIE